MSNPSLQVNFSANTAGFSQGMSQLKQKLSELNTQLEENKQKTRETNAQIKEYEKELKQLEAAEKNSAAAAAEQQKEMQALREQIAQSSPKLLELNTRLEENKQKTREANAQLKECEKELRQLQTATQNGSNATAEQQARMQSLRDKISQTTSSIAVLKTAHQQLQAAISQENAQLREYQRKLSQIEASTRNGNTATGEQQARMQELRDRIAQTTSQLGTLRTAQHDLQGQIRSTNAEIENQETKLESVTSGAMTMGDVLRANLWSSAIQSAVRKLTSSLKQAAQYCYNVGTSFESGMSQVKAISGASESELAQLTQRAKDLGAQTKFTASQAAEAMNYMAMAGWNAQQMLDGIDGVMSLAAASGGDLGQTSDIVTDAITAFGLKAEDVAHFSDVLAAAAANANTNVSMMGETFQYCAPIAGALGFTIEDVSEAIGLMANSGIKSSMAGTALRTLFTNLSQEVKISGQRIGEISVQTSNADGSMRSLKDILADLREAFSQLTDSEKTVQAESIAGKYAMSGFLALMNTGENDINKLHTAIEQCDGASAQMADTMQNNTAGAVVIMQSAIEGLGIAVYEKFGDNLRDDINGLTDVFTDLRERVESGDLDEVFDRVAAKTGKAADQLVDFAAEALPSAIEGIANLISFLVEYRGVILGVIAATLTFKAASSLGNMFATLAGAIKGVTASLAGQTVATAATTAATQKLTAAQIAANIAANANPYVLLASAIIGLAVGIGTLIGSNTSAAESFEDLNKKAKELNETAKESVSAAEDVHKLVEEYKDIKRTADDTEEAKQRLSEIQDTLVDTYGVEADKLDLVNGKYEEQLLLLQNIADAKDENAQYSVRAAYYADVAAQKALSLSDGKPDSTINDIVHYDMNLGVELGNSLEQIASKHGVEYFAGKFESGTSYETLATIYTDFLDENSELFDDIITSGFFTNGNDDSDGIMRRLFDEIVEAREEMSLAAERFNENKTLYDELSADKPAAENTDESKPENWMMYEYSQKGLAEQAAYKKYRNEVTGVDWDDYDSVKKYLEYLRDIEEITQTEYYDRLEEQANTLLEHNTEKWRTAMAEIYKGRNKGGGSGDSGGGNEYDSEKKYLKWRLDMGYITEAEYYKNLAELRDRYLDESSDKWRQATLEIHKYQLSQNKSKLDGIKDQYDSALAAIDEEIKQHDRDREDKDINQQIADIEKQLEYARLDDYSRQQLEQKKQELLGEKSDTEWQRQKEDEREMLSTVYTLAKDAYEQGTADLQSALQTASAVFSAVGTGASQVASTVSTVNNNSVSMIMNAVSQTSEQIAAAVIKALSSEI